MFKFIYLFLAVVPLINGSYAEGFFSDPFQRKYGEDLNSRFVMTTDESVHSLADIVIRDSWWSRPHEYAWAAKFADKEAIVLDAACGISHPFKWYLGETCLETWACDGDHRIDSIDSILQETKDDLGQNAYDVLINKPYLYRAVNLVKASICQLPGSLPQFDRIFCISTLEHLSEKDRKDAITEFARFLSSNGLLVITFDYPEVSPEELIALAESVGLTPAGKVELEKPTNHLLTNGYLSIYRCVFKHKKNSLFAF